MKKRNHLPGICLSLILVIVPFHLSAVDKPLDQIRLPPGFEIDVYIDNLKTARGLDFADTGVLFVGSKIGSVYAVKPNRKAITITNSLLMPVGLDYFEGDLYVSSIYQVVKYKDILQNLDRLLEPAVVIDSLPRDRHHGWKFIKIGPDRKLYVPVGAPCNVCLKTDRRYAGILRMDLDGENLEIFAGGVRNTVGFDWHPESGELWFTDNGRDLMGDNIPPDELNRAPLKGLHFGFPFLHGQSVKDPKYWKSDTGLDFTLPEYEFEAHVAALGMRFYTARQFPEYYRGGIFVAQHGSWNRSSKTGYRIVFLKVQGNRVTDYQIFARGWLQGGRAWGRPVDVEIGPDGALYVSDDKADCVYRISYQGG